MSLLQSSSRRRHLPESKERPDLRRLQIQPQEKPTLNPFFFLLWVKKLDATRRQTWALFCMTKKDHRPFNLTLEKASEIIGKLQKGEVVSDCPCGETHQLKPRIETPTKWQPPEKDYKGRIIVLEAVFDDSDIQTDYWAPDRTIERWFVATVEKPITEGKLRRVLTILPKWLQAYTWKYRKGEKYSMSDHPYGQLRAQESTGLAVKKLASYGGDRPVGLLIDISWLDHFEMNDEVKPLPESLDDIKKLIEDKERNEEERRKRMREKMNEAQAKTIAQSTAVIDGRGFHILTEQEKKEEIVKLQQKELERQKEEDHCIHGYAKDLCMICLEQQKEKEKPKSGTLADYF